jgi:hypothetical protein
VGVYVPTTAFVRSLQSTLDGNHLRSNPQPTADDGREEVVGPFQIQETQGSVDGDEDHFRMEEDPRFFHGLCPQAPVNGKEPRVDVTPDNDPRNVEKYRYGGTNQGRDGL